MKSFLTIVWILTASLTWAQGIPDADKGAVAEANAFVVRGNEFRDNNSLPRAKAEYQKALKVFPRHLDALYNLAVVCEQLGENKEATEHYRRYLELRPNDADVWTQLGVRYDDAGQTAEAQAAYEKALSLNPKYGLAHHNLGVLLKLQGKFDAAQKELETFVKLEEGAGRRNGDAYYSLGVLHLERGRLPDAKRNLQMALDTDPSIAYYNNAMGDVYLTEKEHDLATAAYKKALEKDPKYAPAYSGLGDVYRLTGDRAKAAEAYRKALDLRKDYGLIYYKLGLLYEDNDRAGAIKQFENYLGSGKNLEFQTEAKAKIEKLKNVTASQPQR